MSKPFIKWLGGKRQLMEEIVSNFPETYNHYFEPFIGGGAVFFNVNNKQCYINDKNSELINVYCVIKKHPDELIDSLEKHEISKEYYYFLRALDRTEEFKFLSPVKKASRFIYLNKLGYNGLYRVNSKGQYNVPYGKYKNPKIFDKDNIFLCSEKLNQTEIMNGDFEIIKPFIEENDFVYLDPPYFPLNKTSNFTSYTADGFGVDTNYRLKEFCDYLTTKKVKFLMSNSSSDFIIKLYEGYEIQLVKAKRNINSKADGRGRIDEVLIKNY